MAETKSWKLRDIPYWQWGGDEARGKFGPTGAGEILKGLGSLVIPEEEELTLVPEDEQGRYPALLGADYFRVSPREPIPEEPILPQPDKWMEGVDIYGKDPLAAPIVVGRALGDILSVPQRALFKTLLGRNYSFGEIQNAFEKTNRSGARGMATIAAFATFAGVDPLNFIPTQWMGKAGKLFGLAKYAELEKTLFTIKPATLAGITRIAGKGTVDIKLGKELVKDGFAVVRKKGGKFTHVLTPDAVKIYDDLHAFKNDITKLQLEEMAGVKATTLGKPSQVTSPTGYRRIWGQSEETLGALIKSKGGIKYSPDMGDLSEYEFVLGRKFFDPKGQGYDEIIAELIQERVLSPNSAFDDLKGMLLRGDTEFPVRWIRGEFTKEEFGLMHAGYSMGDILKKFSTRIGTPRQVKKTPIFPEATGTIRVTEPAIHRAEKATGAKVAGEAVPEVKAIQSTEGVQVSNYLNSVGESDIRYMRSHQKDTIKTHGGTKIFAKGNTRESAENLAAEIERSGIAREISIFQDRHNGWGVEFLGNPERIKEIKSNPSILTIKPTPQPKPIQTTEGVKNTGQYPVNITQKVEGGGKLPPKTPVKIQSPTGKGWEKPPAPPPSPPTGEDMPPIGKIPPNLTGKPSTYWQWRGKTAKTMQKPEDWLGEHLFNPVAELYRKEIRPRIPNWALEPGDDFWGAYQRYNWRREELAERFLPSLKAVEKLPAATQERLLQVQKGSLTFSEEFNKLAEPVKKNVAWINERLHQLKILDKTYLTRLAKKEIKILEDRVTKLTKEINSLDMPPAYARLTPDQRLAIWHSVEKKAEVLDHQRNELLRTLWDNDKGVGGEQYAKLMYDRQMAKNKIPYIKGRPSMKLSLKYSVRREALTPEQRLAMGEVRTISEPLSLTYAEAIHDIPMAEFFDEISKNPDIVSDVAISGYFKLPDTPKLGALSGKYLRADGYKYVAELVEPGGLGSQLLALWKTFKTAYNPATILRNGYWNIVLADTLGQLSPYDLDIYGRAIYDYFKKAGYYNEFKPWLKQTYAIEEIRKPLERLLGTSKRGTISAVRQVLLKGTGIYGFSEDIFKMAVFTKQRLMGKSIREAAEIAQVALFDYARVPYYIKWLRQSPLGAPFATFYYKQLAAIPRMILRNPLRMGKYVLAYLYFRRFVRKQLGISAELEQMVRDIQPGDDNGGYVVLPYKDPEYIYILDLGYIIPFSDPYMEYPLIPRNLRKYAQYLAPLTPFSGPVATIPQAVAAEYKKPGSTAADVWGVLWRQLMPSLVPGGYGYKKIEKAVSGEAEGILQEPRRVGEVLRETIGGIKIRRVKKSEVINIWDAQQGKELKDLIAGLYRERDEGKLKEINRAIDEKIKMIDERVRAVTQSEQKQKTVQTLTPEEWMARKKEKAKNK